MPDSGASTPRAFTSQAQSTEELLKSQTVGLVQLNDFRKRRKDVEDLTSDGVLTPKSDGSENEVGSGFRKKKQKVGGRKLLSFDHDDEGSPERLKTSSSKIKQDNIADTSLKATEPSSVERKLKSNPNAKLPAPRAKTKASLAAEATERERLRVEFLKVQEQVRDSEIAIPFIFYDGSNTPGGIIKVKKGDHIWLFLEKCRKVGANMGVSGEGSITGGATKQPVVGKKSWARIGVDDLMLVRGESIIPHHYEFYYFIANRTFDPNCPERLLFDYSCVSPQKGGSEEGLLLRNPKNERIEGQDDDADYTKVVDRRWYEKNKHIYPASLWQEYESGQDSEEVKKGRKDAQGNLFFFS